MANQESLFDLWNFMEFSEKKQLMQQYYKVHGNHYNKNDFIKFLVERSKGSRETCKSVDGKPKKGRDNL